MPLTTQFSSEFDPKGIQDLIARLEQAEQAFERLKQVFSNVDDGAAVDSLTERYGALEGSIDKNLAKIAQLEERLKNLATALRIPGAPSDTSSGDTDLIRRQVQAGVLANRQQELIALGKTEAGVQNEILRIITQRESALARVTGELARQENVAAGLNREVTKSIISEPDKFQKLPGDRGLKTLFSGFDPEILQVLKSEIDRLAGIQSSIRTNLLRGAPETLARTVADQERVLKTISDLEQRRVGIQKQIISLAQKYRLEGLDQVKNAADLDHLIELQRGNLQASTSEIQTLKKKFEELASITSQIGVPGEETIGTLGAQLNTLNAQIQAIEEDSGASLFLGDVSNQIRTLAETAAQLEIGNIAAAKELLGENNLALKEYLDVLTEIAEAEGFEEQTKAAAKYEPRLQALKEALFGVRDASIEAFDETQAIKRVNDFTKGVLGAFRGFARRMEAALQFAFAGGAILGVRAFTKEFFEAVVEVERTFKDIETAVAFDIGTQSAAQQTRAIDELRRGVQDLAIGLRVLPTVANEVAFQSISRFDDITTALAATEEQLKAIKVAIGLDPQETIRATNAIASAYGQQFAILGDGTRILTDAEGRVKAMNRAINNATVLQQRYGITVEDSLEAVASIAPVFSQIGLTLAETQAAISIAARDRGLTGAQAGEQLARPFSEFLEPSRVQRLIELSEATNLLNLSFADFATGGAEAFRKILTSYSDLPTNLQSAITGALGDSRSQPIIQALLNGADEYNAAVANVVNNTDAADKRVSELGTTLQERLKEIRASFQVIAQNLASLGALAPIKTFITLLQTGLRTVARFTQEINTLVARINSIDPGGLISKLLGRFGFRGLGDLVVGLASISFTLRRLTGGIGRVKGILAPGLSLGVAAARQTAKQAGRVAPLAAAGAAGRASAQVAGLIGGFTRVTAVLAAFATSLSQGLGRVLAGGLTPFRIGLGAAWSAVRAFTAALFDSIRLRFANEVLFGGGLKSTISGGLGAIVGSGAGAFAARFLGFQLAITALGNFFDKVIPALLRARRGSRDFRAESERAAEDAVAGFEEAAAIGDIDVSKTRTSFVVDAARDALRSAEADLAQVAPGGVEQRIAQLQSRYTQDFADVFNPRRLTNDFLALLSANPIEVQESDLAEALAGDTFARIDLVKKQFQDVEFRTRRAIENFGEILSPEELSALREANQTALSNVGELDLLLADIPQGTDNIGRLIVFREDFNQKGIALQRLLSEYAALAEDVGVSASGLTSSELAQADIDRAVADFNRGRISLSQALQELDIVGKSIEITRAEGLEISPETDDALFDQIISIAQSAGDRIRGTISNFDSAQVAAAKEARAAELEARLISDRLGIPVARLKEVLPELFTTLNDSLRELANAQIESFFSLRLAPLSTEAEIKSNTAKAKRSYDQALAAVQATPFLRNPDLDQTLVDATIELRRAQAEEVRFETERFAASLRFQAGVANRLLSSQNEVAIAQREVADAFSIYGENSVEFYDAMLNLERAEAEVASTVLDQRDVLRRLGSDITNPVEQLALDLQKIADELANPDLGKLERAELELEQRRLQNDFASETANKILDDLSFAFEIGNIGLATYIARLRDLARSIDRSTDQGQELWEQIQLQIKGLIDGAEDAFNIPTEIRLPTLFEIRRAVQAEALGLNVNDNRNQYINVTVGNRLELDDFFDALNDFMGGSLRLNSGTSQPYVALGGFNG